MSDVANRRPGASVATHFGRWYATVTVVVITMLSTGRHWPSAIGVVVGSGVFLLKSRRVRYAMRAPLTGSRPRPGMIIFAATQAMVGVVCIFVGALIQGELLLIFSAAFGTWQISSAALVVVVAGAAKRDNPDA